MFTKFMLKLLLEKIIFLVFLGFSISANSQNTSSSSLEIEKSVSEKSALGSAPSFCIFNVIEKKLTGIKVSIFSTDRLTGCEESEYHKLTAISISTQLQTFMKPAEIVKSGVHTPVMSKDLSPVNEPYIEIGKFRFRKTGELSVSYFTFFYHYLTDPRYRKGFTGLMFTPLKVSGVTFFIYNPGLRVYQLKSPDGKTFTMTTFSNLINASLTLDGLINLAPSLELPSGWTFSTQVLDKQISIRSRVSLDETEFVLDNFGNFYARTQ
jgi:hypothetical protein